MLNLYIRGYRYLREQQRRNIQAEKTTLFKLQTQELMGLPGFEPGSREPKSPSLDQASRQPPLYLHIRIETPKDKFKTFSQKTKKDVILC